MTSAAHPNLLAAPNRVRLATLVVVMASMATGTLPWFARTLTDAGIDPVAVAFFRLVLPAAVLAGTLPRDPAHRRALWWGVGTGVGMAVGWVAYVWSLERLPVATVGVVYLSFPVFTLVVGWTLFGQRISARGLGAGLLILIGAALALGPSGIGSWTTLAVMLLAPLTFGASIAVLCERLGELEPGARVGSTCLGGSLALLPVMLSRPAEAIVPSPRLWWAVVAIGLFTALIPMMLYATAAPHAGMSRSAAAGTVELPAMIGVGLVMGESLDPIQLVAAALVVVAIVMSPPPARTPAALEGDEAGAVVRAGAVAQPRWWTSSATRKARSRDWLALRRGSHTVS